MLSSDLFLLDRTPILAIAIDNALAGNGNVLSTLGAQRRLQTTGVKTFERGLDDRIQ